MSSDSHDNDFEDSDEFRLGENGERLVEAFTQWCGWSTMPARRYNGEGAPTLQRLHEHTVLPDILAVKDGKSRFVEVKTKRDGPSFYRKTQKEQHGVDWANWKAYCDTQRETGLDVWLFVYEPNSGTLLRAAIDDLEMDHRLLEDDPGYNAYGSEMIFWDRDNFESVTASIETGDFFFGQQKLDSGVGAPSNGAFGGDNNDGDNDQRGLGDFSEGWE